MGKAAQRKKDRRLERAAGNGAPAAPAPDQAGPKKRKLSGEEALAVQFLEASNLLDQKNVEIGELTQQVVNLKIALLNAQNQNQALKRSALVKKFGLPKGDMRMLEDDGAYTLEYSGEDPKAVPEAKAPPVKPGKALVEPEDESEEPKGEEGPETEESEAAPAAPIAPTPAK